VRRRIKPAEEFREEVERYTDAERPWAVGCRPDGRVHASVKGLGGDHCNPHAEFIRI
jgi:hypothetical protein